MLNGTLRCGSPPSNLVGTSLQEILVRCWRNPAGVWSARWNWEKAMGAESSGQSGDAWESPWEAREE